jgi:hypothetical protein
LWLQSNVLSDEVHSAAAQLGADWKSVVESDGGRTIPVTYSFTDRRDTDWESSTVTGTWRAALVEPSFLGSADRVDRLIGVAGPTTSIVYEVFKQFQDQLDNIGVAHEQVDFPIRYFLAPESVDSGLEPVSVRLQQSNGTALVKSDTWAQLRESLAQLEGDLIGVTLRAAEEVLSVLPGGSIVFDDVSPVGLLRAATLVEQALTAPEVA